jgi:hypothetical protein
MFIFSIGFPPRHYATMNAFIDFTTNHHLDLDVNLFNPDPNF